MFLKVKMEDQTLVINLGADITKANDLVNMFEKNAKVIQEHSREIKLLDVTSTIELGSELVFENSGYSGEESKLVLTSDSEIVGCVNADVNAFIDLKTITDKHVDQVKNLNDSITQLRAQLTVANNRIKELEEAKEEVKKSDKI